MKIGEGNGDVDVDDEFTAFRSRFLLFSCLMSAALPAFFRPFPGGAEESLCKFILRGEKYERKKDRWTGTRP